MNPIMKESIMKSSNCGSTQTWFWYLDNLKILTYHQLGNKTGSFKFLMTQYVFIGWNFFKKLNWYNYHLKGFIWMLITFYH